MTLNELKKEVCIMDVMQKLGVELERNGRCKCPFHEDKNPSMQVSKSKQIATCFSSNCDAGTMDVFDFIEKKLQVSTHQAAQWLKENFFISSETENSKTTISTQERFILLEKAFGYFHNGLQHRQDNNGRNYLIGRAINIESLQELGVSLGYNSAQFHHRDRFSLQEKEDFCKIGLLKPTDNSKTGIGYNAWAAHCVVFPLKNKQGKIVSLYGRSVVDKGHFYLQNRSGLFPFYPPVNTQKIILTESIIDACSLLQFPFISSQYSVLALYGTNGFLQEHQNALKELQNLQEIILFMDGDEAGELAALKLSQQIHQLRADISISQVVTPKNEDPNSLLIAHEGDVYKHLLEERKYLFAYQQEPTSPSLIEKDDILYFEKDHVSFQILGKLPSALDSLKIRLHTKADYCPHTYRASVELYEDKALRSYCKGAVDLLHLDAEHLLKLLYELSDLLEQHRNKLLSEQKPHKQPSKVMSLEERKWAVDFLSQKNLMELLNQKLAQTGIVGEENNRLFLFLIALSHLTQKPLHALIQGSSGSGKTRLLKQITACIPSENKLIFTRLSEKVLYNFPEDYLSHKLIAIEDADGMGEEAEFAFRELQSGGELRSAISIKQQNGQMDAGERIVKGPVATLMCTTKGSLYEDNMGRMFAISVDESPAQTQAIIHYQNQKAAGNVDETQEQKSIDFIQNLVRCIKPLKTLNPYANAIKLPKQAHKIRRLNELFHGMIHMVTLLHQYQRQTNEYQVLITTPQDIEMATEIMFSSIMLKVDELDGALRDFYENLKLYLKQNYNGSHQESDFTQREIRQHLRISKSQLQRYILELSELEYIGKSGGHSNRGFLYKVLHWDEYAVLQENIKKDLFNQIKSLNINKKEALAAIN